MTLADDNARLAAENTALAARITEVEQQLAAALARIAELEQQRHDPPPFIQPNRPKAAEPKRPRKKRALEHNHGRRPEPPTRIEPHALDRCPECNYRLQGHSLDYTRQVVELPPAQPLEVVEHQVIKRWCPAARRGAAPNLILPGRCWARGASVSVSLA